MHRIHVHRLTVYKQSTLAANWSWCMYLAPNETRNPLPSQTKRQPIHCFTWLYRSTKRGFPISFGAKYIVTSASVSCWCWLFVHCAHAHPMHGTSLVYGIQFFLMKDIRGNRGWLSSKRQGKWTRTGHGCLSIGSRTRQEHAKNTTRWFITSP